MDIDSLKRRRKAAGFVVLFALALSIMTSAANAQDKEPTGITVTGRGEVMAAPDIAYVSLGVVTRDASARQAAAENARIAQAITNAVKALGVADKDIQTQSYSIQPWMEYPREGPPRQLGYEVRNTVRVTVRDIRKVGDIIDAGIKAGANSVQGVTFDIDNDEALQQQALAEAVRDARRKAETIANTLKVPLGTPISVTATGGFRPPPPIFRGEAVGAPALETPISPGQVEVIQDVTITFAIRR